MHDVVVILQPDGIDQGVLVVTTYDTTRREWNWIECRIARLIVESRTSETSTLALAIPRTNTGHFRGTEGIQLFHFNALQECVPDESLGLSVGTYCKQSC